MDLSALGNMFGTAAAAYLPYEAAQDTIDDLKTSGPAMMTAATELGQTAADKAAFTPFSVRTASGGSVNVGAGGGYDMSLSDAEKAMMQYQSDQMSTIAGQELPTAQGLFEQLQAAQAGQNERTRLEMENRLAAQGRLGVGTAMYGGTPEQLAMEKAMQEQMASNMLSAQQLAPQLQQQQIANMGGLMANYYNPQNQAIAAMSPATNLANIATSAGLGQSEAIYKGGIEGLESQQAAKTAIANLEASRVNALSDALTGLFSGTGEFGTGASPLERLLTSFVGK